MIHELPCELCFSFAFFFGWNGSTQNGAKFSMSSFSLVNTLFIARGAAETPQSNFGSFVPTKPKILVNSAAH